MVARAVSGSTSTAAGGVNININVNVSSAASSSSTAAAAPRSEAESNPKAIENWRRLVKTAGRIRRLQRYFGLLGQFLQTFGKNTRDNLIKIYKKE
jgi:hypothetical protein